MAASQQAWRCRWIRHPSEPTTPPPPCSCGCSSSSSSSASSASSSASASSSSPSPSSAAAAAAAASSSSSSSHHRTPPQAQPACLCLSLLCQSISPRSTSQVSLRGLYIGPHSSSAQAHQQRRFIPSSSYGDEIEMKDIEMKEMTASACRSLEGDWLSSVPGRDKGGERGDDVGGMVCISRKRTRQNGWGVNSETAAAMLAMQHQHQQQFQQQQQHDESCKLPDHLIESVLARLPLQSFFRFRAVCSSWNSYLYSNTFLKAYSEAGNRLCIWFLVVTANLGRSSRYGQRVVATYDPEYNNWHRIPLPAPLCDLNPYPTAADGGLVCYFVYENRLRTLFVCNPLTKSLRKLPLVLKCSSHISVLKMAVEDPKTNSYLVFVAGMVPAENGGDSLTMEVYNSSTDSWTKCGIIPAKYPKRKPVYGNGVLYVRCYDQRSLLITYDMNLGVWNRICAPLPHTLGYEELVHHRGHVFLVGVLEENYKIESVCIWELQNKLPYPSYVWKEVDRMPRVLFLEFFCDREFFECQEDERVLMKCCLYGDLILLVAFNISHRGPFKLLAYDLPHKTWRRLPESFHANECRTHKFIEGIIYEPRLDVEA